MIKFVEVIEMEKINCTMDWLRQRAEFWPKSLEMMASASLNLNGRVFFTLDEDGQLGFTTARPIGTELMLGYKHMDWIVDSVKEITREVVEVDGSLYYKDDLLEALKGKEIK